MSISVRISLFAATRNSKAIEIERMLSVKRACDVANIDYPQELYAWCESNGVDPGERESEIIAAVSHISLVEIDGMYSEVHRTSAYAGTVHIEGVEVADEPLAVYIPISELPKQADHVGVRVWVG